MIVVALSAIVALAGCAGKVGRANYYTLNLPAPPDPPVAENAHTTVAIREFRAPAYLRQGAIVYKPSPEQIGFYTYHRWAIDPCDFVTDSIINHLGATGTFTRVKHYDGQPDADYVVSGRLEKLEEIDYEGGVKVEVAVSAQMIKLETGTIVWSKAVFGSRSCQPTRRSYGGIRNEPHDGTSDRETADAGAGNFDRCVNGGG